MKTKNNLTVMMLSCVVCLLPLILSFAVYGDLPEQITVQWDIAGEPANIIPKAFVAFGLPFIFMAVNIISKIRANDPKQEAASAVTRTVYMWLVPFISLIFVPVTLFMAKGASIPVSLIAPLGIGILFIILGNYMPKNRQNYVIGIRLPWTLNDADNWNKTHRLAGYLRILGGIALIISSFISFEKSAWVVFSLAVLGLNIFVPFVYSYLFFKKNGNNGQTSDE